MGMWAWTEEANTTLRGSSGLFRLLSASRAGAERTLIDKAGLVDDVSLGRFCPLPCGGDGEGLSGFVQRVGQRGESWQAC